MARSNENLTHRVFEVGIALKAINAGMECIAGLALALVPTSWFTAALTKLTQHELQEDPRDFVASHLIGWVQHLSPATNWYYAVYLFAHGAVKLGLVLALFRGWVWAYPLSLAVFGGFVVYQLYEFTFIHSLGLIFLSIVDVVVMWLIWREYIDVRRKRADAESTD